MDRTLKTSIGIYNIIRNILHAHYCLNLMSRVNFFVNLEFFLHPNCRSQFSHESSSSKSTSSDRISFDRNSEFKQINPPRMRRSTNSPTLSADSFSSETSSHQNSLSGSDFSGPFSFQSNGSDNEGNRNSFSPKTPVSTTSIDPKILNPLFLLSTTSGLVR